MPWSKALWHSSSQHEDGLHWVVRCSRQETGVSARVQHNPHTASLGALSPPSWPGSMVNCIARSPVALTQACMSFLQAGGCRILQQRIAMPKLLRTTAQNATTVADAAGDCLVYICAKPDTTSRTLGFKVGVVRILNFSTATEVLQGKAGCACLCSLLLRQPQRVTCKYTP